MPLQRRLIDAYQRTSAAGDRLRRAMRRQLRVSPQVIRLPFESLSLTTSDGLMLRGWHIPAAHGGRASAQRLGVVLHHHYGGQKATVLPWLRLFHQLGLEALAVDGRGHGESSPRPIGLDCFVQRARDVHAAVDELRGRGVARVICFGQSQGAAVVAFASGARADVAGVILDSGPPPAMELAAWGLAGAMLDDGRVEWGLPERLLATARMLVRTRPLRFNQALWTALVRLRDRPLLWIHGDKDVVIPREWSRLWFEALRPRGSDRWRALEVAGGEHVRTLQAQEQLVAAAVRQYVQGLALEHRSARKP